MMKSLLIAAERLLGWLDLVRFGEQLSHRVAAELQAAVVEQRGNQPPLGCRIDAGYQLVREPATAGCMPLVGQEFLQLSRGQLVLRRGALRDRLGRAAKPV